MAWSLISSMAVIDAATDERNCGQISYPGSSFQKTIETVCAASDRGFGQSGTVVFHNPLLASDLCRKDCTMDDQYCKLQNAGGTIALSSLGKSPRGNWGCSDCSGPFPPSGVEGQMQGCSQSSMPFVCRLQSSVRDEDLVDGHAWAPYGKSEGYAFAAIGETGAGMQALFQTSEGRLSDAWTVGGNQCKFLRENWAVWIRSIQRFYRTVFEAYDASTKVLSAEFDSTIGGNYLMSCPGYGYNFFENEVNLYFNRKSSEPGFQRLAEQQSEVLRRSIVGFYVTGLTCEEQLHSLEGIPCSVGAKTFAGARDRVSLRGVEQHLLQPRAAERARAEAPHPLRAGLPAPVTERRCVCARICKWVLGATPSRTAGCSRILEGRGTRPSPAWCCRSSRRSCRCASSCLRGASGAPRPRCKAAPGLAAPRAGRGRAGPRAPAC